jgi:hypothetical protein
MRAALPREGGIADQHNKRKQPSEIRRLTSQRGAKPSKRSCLRRCLSRPIKTKAPRGQSLKESKLLSKTENPMEMRRG